MIQDSKIKPYVCSWAIEVAKSSEHKLFRVGAVLAKGNKIISYGTNSPRKTSPVIYNLISKFSIVDKKHAEMSCILPIIHPIVRQNLNRYKLYVAKVGTRGASMARPCELCMMLIKKAGIRRIYYTDHNGLWQGESVLA